MVSKKCLKAQNIQNMLQLWYIGLENGLNEKQLSSKKMPVRKNMHSRYMYKS